MVQSELNLECKGLENGNCPSKRLIKCFPFAHRLIVVMNLTHTVNDLRMYVVNSRPSYAASPFSLSTSFPSKELTNEHLTIEEAKLQGAVVIQKFKA